MKLRYVLICILLAMSCSSSKTDETGRKAAKDYPNLVTLNPPINQKAAPSAIYVDSVKIIRYKNKKALLIKGHFANGCTSLEEVSSNVEGNTLTLSLKGWQPTDRMCTQALVPFVFIYDEFSSDQLAAYNTVRVNKASFKLKQQ